MTEKQYGGNTGRESKSALSVKSKVANASAPETKQKKKSDINSKPDKTIFSSEDKILQAGKISAKVREYAKSFIKTDMKLLEIAEKIENKIIELGGKPAFPTNLSMNEIAAHYTPSYNDVSEAHGLLKIDFGVHIDGFIADTAFSLDLENSKENKKLIEIAEECLKNAVKIAKQGILLSEIGKTIQETAEKNKFSPIVNLSGHSMEKYDLHSGITISNVKDSKKEILEQGVYAIEPFVTNGNGKVHDGKPSGIYALTDSRNIRSQSAREVLAFIEEEYQTLPFCSRWLYKKFGAKALFALKELENNGNLHQFPQLVEVSKSKVSQAEHTILVEKDKVIVTTE